MTWIIVASLISILVLGTLAIIAVPGFVLRRRARKLCRSDQYPALRAARKLRDDDKDMPP